MLDKKTMLMIGGAALVIGVIAYQVTKKDNKTSTSEGYGLEIKRLGENTARTTDISNIIMGTEKKENYDGKRERSYATKLMPSVTSDVTPFNVDVTNPATHRTLGFQPRVELKSKYQDFSLANFVRGDTPVTTYPDIPLISRTQQDYSDVRVGLFSEKGTNTRWADATPKVSMFGQASGYGGIGGATIVN